MIKQVANLIKEVEKENKSRQVAGQPTTFGQHVRPAISNVKFEKDNTGKRFKSDSYSKNSSDF